MRVLAPCDGPPPDSGITTLGASLPTAANGSIAPIAPDLPAQIRLIKALWNEEFDVLHIHEPLAPGIGINIGAHAGGAHGWHIPCSWPELGVSVGKPRMPGASQPVGDRLRRVSGG